MWQGLKHCGSRGEGMEALVAAWEDCPWCYRQGAPSCAVCCACPAVMSVMHVCCFRAVFSNLQGVTFASLSQGFVVTIEDIERHKDQPAPTTVHSLVLLLMSNSKDALKATLQVMPGTIPTARVLEAAITCFYDRKGLHSDKTRKNGWALTNAWALRNMISKIRTAKCSYFV